MRKASPNAKTVSKSFKSEKNDTETRKTLQSRLRMEWEAVAAAKNLVDDMVTYETAPDGNKLDYNAPITEMNKIAAPLEGAFDAVTMTKVHIGLNGRTKKSEIWCWCDWRSKSVSGNSSFFPQWILCRLVVTEFMVKEKRPVVSVKIVIASCFRSLLSCSLWIVTVAHALDRYCLASFGSLFF